MGKVLSYNNYFYVAGEYMEFKHCKVTSIGQDERSTNVWLYFVRGDSVLFTGCSSSWKDLFLAIHTKKYVCDNKVVVKLRSRTAGNGPTVLRNAILEKHTCCWMIEQQCYMTDCFMHKYGDLMLAYCS